MPEVTRASVGSVTRKLHGFAEGLEPEERTILNALMATAAAGDTADADVSGFTASLPSFDLGTSSFDLAAATTEIERTLTQGGPVPEGGTFITVVDGYRR